MFRFLPLTLSTQREEVRTTISPFLSLSLSPQNKRTRLLTSQEENAIIMRMQHVQYFSREIYVCIHKDIKYIYIKVEKNCLLMLVCVCFSVSVYSSALKKTFVWIHIYIYKRLFMVIFTSKAKSSFLSIRNVCVET